MLKVCAVFDAKGASYGTPMFVSTVAIAGRHFADACRDARSPLAVHSSDFSLYELGDYDPNSGRITSLPNPKWLASASSVVAELDKPRQVVDIKVEEKV